MELSFRYVNKVTVKGCPYILQRAIVTRNRKFWALWRSSPHHEPGNRTIKNVLQLRREIIDKRPEWVAYRLVPIISNIPDGRFAYGTFPEYYSLKDRSRLLPYQIKAVGQLCQAVVRFGAALDGSDTGIGKTYHALSVCRNLSVRPGIICKKSGVAGWKQACRYMKVHPLFIANWDIVKNGKFPYVKRKGDPYTGEYRYFWNLPKDTILIFDEAHLANNKGSQNNAMYSASAGIPSLSLSATFADRPSRLRALFHVLGICTNEQFDEWLRSRGHFFNTYNQEEGISDQDDLKYLNSILYPRYGTRISYDHPEVKKNFPEASYQTFIISLSNVKRKKQNEEYKKLVKSIAYFQELGRQADALVADLRYRQITELLKVDSLTEITRSSIIEGYSVCIFVNFRETLEFLSRKLKTNSKIYGGQGSERERVINEFQENKSRIILAMADAGGSSINLHDVRGGHPRISLVCPTYNPITLKQVLGRTRRAGSKTFPIVKLVYAAGTIEEKVARIVNSKMDNISALNDGDLYEPDIFNLNFRRS